jgi:hypothetical protein
LKKNKNRVKLFKIVDKEGKMDKRIKFVNKVKVFAFWPVYALEYTLVTFDVSKTAAINYMRIFILGVIFYLSLALGLDAFLKLKTWSGIAVILMGAVVYCVGFIPIFYEMKKEKHPALFVRPAETGSEKKCEIR